MWKFIFLELKQDVGGNVCVCSLQYVSKVESSMYASLASQISLSYRVVMYLLVLL